MIAQKGQKPKAMYLKYLCILPENLARASGPGESTAGVSLCENTPIKLLQGWAQLEHSSHIVKVVVKGTW